MNTEHAARRRSCLSTRALSHLFVKCCMCVAVGIRPTTYSSFSVSDHPLYRECWPINHTKFLRDQAMLNQLLRCVLCCWLAQIYICIYVVCMFGNICMPACMRVHLSACIGRDGDFNQLSLFHGLSWVHGPSWIHRGLIVGPSLVHGPLPVNGSIVGPSWVHCGPIVGPWFIMGPSSIVSPWSIVGLSWVHGSSWVRRPS